MTWHAADAAGLDPGTGRPPRGPGRPTPAAALAAVPVPVWPLAAVADHGRRRTFAAALGPGGDAVTRLLDALAGPPLPLDPQTLGALARATPAGNVDLPLTPAPLTDAVTAAAGVDADWLELVDSRRAAARRALTAAGRGDALEAALHVAVLLATQRLDPVDDADVDAHVASGASLWLLTGAVASALAGPRPGPFAAWARLVTAGWWPVGPSEGRLVVCPCDAFVRAGVVVGLRCG